MRWGCRLELDDGSGCRRRLAGDRRALCRRALRRCALRSRRGCGGGGAFGCSTGGLCVGRWRGLLRSRCRLGGRRLRLCRLGGRRPARRVWFQPVWWSPVPVPDPARRPAAPTQARPRPSRKTRRRDVQSQPTDSPLPPTESPLGDRMVPRSYRSFLVRASELWHTKDPGVAGAFRSFGSTSGGNKSPLVVASIGSAIGCHERFLSTRLGFLENLFFER